MVKIHPLEIRVQRRRRRAHRPWPEESDLLERTADGEQTVRGVWGLTCGLTETAQRVKRDHRAEAVGQDGESVAAVLPRARHLRVKALQNLEGGTFTATIECM